MTVYHEYVVYNSVCKMLERMTKNKWIILFNAYRGKYWPFFVQLHTNIHSCGGLMVHTVQYMRTAQ